MKLLINWTDIFNGIGTFFQWMFKGIKALGHGPNVIIWVMIIGAIFYWTLRLTRYKKEAQRNSTIE